MNKILDFYSNQASDDRGRYLRDIQTWPDDRLESVHDFIQWMFPLQEPSGANPRAPRLDRDTIVEFRSRPDLQQNLETSFCRMLRFYGFEMKPDLNPRVLVASNFSERSKEWLRPANHNHLRISRILRSSRILGLELHAQVLYDCLAALYGEECAAAYPRIKARTFAYWQSAANHPILL